MKLIDEKGRLFGIINIVDFAVVLVILFVIFLGVRAYQFTINPKKVTGHANDYIAKRLCPNCGVKHGMWFEKGTLLPDTIEATCDTCGIKSVFVINEPAIKPDVRVDWQQLHYKGLVQDRDIKKRQTLVEP